MLYHFLTAGKPAGHIVVSYDQGMSLPDVIAHYDARLVDLQTAIRNLQVPHLLAMCVFAVALCSCVALSFYILRGQLSSLSLSLPVLITAASAHRMRQVRQSESQFWRLKRLYERAVERVKGNWAGSGVRGEEFSDPNHVYSADLNLFGEGSLFELLCTARTSIGRRGLADYLVETPALEETLLRQAAVHELRDNVQLRERIATLGEFESLESHRAPFDEWLASPKLSFARPLPLIAAVTSVLFAAFVVAGLLGVIPWLSVAICISPIVAFHTGVGIVFRDRVNRIADSLRSLSIETRVLREGLQLLETERFQSAKLRLLVRQVQDGSQSIRKLQRLLNALEQRNKEWFYGPSLALLLGTQLAMAIETWQSKHESSLRTWLQAWAEFEALNMLALYAYENPQNCFPEFAQGEACFEARELGHPLMPRGSCVTNNIALTRESPFYIISGSNMSGKSTLLRTIGVNAVLAFAGAAVRAGALRLSGMSIVASISIVDSLSSGKSKFLAEVGRLRQAMDRAAPESPVLFLVDEIFGGTNSRDRRIAAEAVVRALVDRGAIGALSTHDLALTEIASSEGMHGTNVHMGSSDLNDPMAFDYRLKPGVTQETNALVIARLAGVPV
jgi:ABC-type multidrug transport system fused ATPase/permease subunit